MPYYLTINIGMFYKKKSNNKQKYNNSKLQQLKKIDPTNTQYETTQNWVTLYEAEV